MCIRDRLYKELKQREYNVKVFTTDASHSIKKRIKVINESINNPDIYRFKYLFRFKQFFCFAPLLVLKLLFFKYDLIHLHNIHDAHLIICILIKIIRRKKLIITGHNPFVHNQNSLTIKLYHILLSLFINKIDKYIALTEEEEKNVINILHLKKEKIVVIPNSIDESFLMIESKEEKKNKTIHKYLEKFDINIDLNKYVGIVGWYGRFDEVKNLHILKEAIQKTKTLLYIFQGPKNNDYYDYLINDLKDLKNVILINRNLKIEDIIEFLKLIDVFVFPSKSESFGLTPLEAMSAGVLTIVSNTTAISDLMIKNKIDIVLNNSKESWSKQLQDIQNWLSQHQNINQIEKLRKIIEKYKDFTSRFSNNTIISKILNLYSNYI